MRREPQRKHRHGAMDPRRGRGCVHLRGTGASEMDTLLLHPLRSAPATDASVIHSTFAEHLLCAITVPLPQHHHNSHNLILLVSSLFIATSYWDSPSGSSPIIRMMLIIYLLISYVSAYCVTITVLGTRDMMLSRAENILHSQGL